MKAKIVKLEEEISVLNDRVSEDDLNLLSLKQQLYEAKIKLNELSSINYEERINEVELKAEWSSVKMMWASIFGEYGNQKIRTYNLNNSFDNQITKITPETYKLGVSWNFFYDQANNLPKNFTWDKGYLLNGLYSVSYYYSSTNNVDELSADEFRTESMPSTSGDDVRYLYQSVQAYDDSLYDEFDKHTLAFSINKKVLDNLFFSMAYDINFISNSSKYNGDFQNLKLGIIIGFVNSKEIDKKTIINIEPFVLFKDLGDKFEDSGDEFYKRSLIGIRTTIPFSNIFSSK